MKTPVFIFILVSVSINSLSRNFFVNNWDKKLDKSDLSIDMHIDIVSQISSFNFDFFFSNDFYKKYTASHHFYEKYTFR